MICKSLTQVTYLGKYLLTLLLVDTIPDDEMIVSSPLRTISHQRLEFSGGFCSSVPHQGGCPQN